MNTFEDIPDMKGDMKGGYHSFALAQNFFFFFD
jgi:hypothetical protein